MVFDSIVYAVFLPTVVAVYYCLRHRYQNLWLLAASWFFYGWWDWRFVSLLVVSTVVDFICAKSIHRSQNTRRRRAFLLVSVITNLSILGFFKYFNFFADSAIELFGILGFHPSFMTLNVILPMGISFYTFQTMSYTIDVYRRRSEPCRDLVSFAVYVSFFPQLVAGPIERASRLLPQIENPRSVKLRDLREGGVLILIGLFKKMAIADSIAPLVETRFADPGALAGFDLLLGLYLFAIQIYCDFSGYSDIARGSAKLLGVDLMVNFRRPYFATSITEFWRRWHISLSSWLRDYLYIPLGGNRGGTFLTYRNLMLTMLIGGLWHGASWAFVVWGGLHGLYLAVHKAIGGPKGDHTRDKGVLASINHLWKGIATFHLVCLTWIFFRARSFGDAWEYLHRIFVWPSTFTLEPTTAIRLVILLGVIFLVEMYQSRTDDELSILRLRPVVRGVVYAVLIVVMIALGGMDAEIPFIYFQF